MGAVCKLLVANLAHLLVEGTDWEYSEVALYDLGQAVAHMTVQARALGLQARQFRAFDRNALTDEFVVPAHWQATSMTAIGCALAPTLARQRRTTTELQWPDADNSSRG